MTFPSNDLRAYKTSCALYSTYKVDDNSDSYGVVTDIVGTGIPL